MSLALSLNNALSGLNINRQSLAVLSQNIANANTPGYSRKIINQESLYLDGNGAGVSIKDISRKVDDYLIRSVREQNSKVGEANTISDYADRIQILLGKPGNRDSVDANISSFFNALQSLAETPENSSLRVNAVNIGKTLAGRVSDLSNGLNDLRFQADQDIKLLADAVNNDIKEIDKLNKTINTEKALGKSVGDLLDKRDSLVKDLSQYLDVQTYSKPSGEISISTVSGVGLLDDSVYELSYNPAGSIDSFANNVSLSPLLVYRLDEKGNQTGTPKELVSGGTSETTLSAVSSGKLSGLLEMRDGQIPDILKQLDNMAMVMRDTMNAVHNTGTGYPGADELTGTHLLSTDDYSQWSGSIRIAVLDSKGQPIAPSYADEPSSRPLDLDLSTLNTGIGDGKPTVQGIIDEINSKFGVPQNKVVLGNINNISLVSNSKNLPGVPPLFNFDFNMENISADNAEVFVTDVQILDDTDTALTAPTSTLPAIALAASNNYVTTAGSKTVTINTTGTGTLKNGDSVYLSVPSGAIDGIPTDNFGQYFTVSNVQNGSFDISVATAATAGGTYTESTQTITPKYTDIAAGDSVRTKASGTITADLSSNQTSSYYTVKVSVGVKDATGKISTSVVSYRVNNNDANLLNNRYAATAANLDGDIVAPSSLQPVLVAKLVDENGVELAKFNGAYTTTKKGYLQIVAGNSSSYIAIDPLDSVELGKPNDTPPTAATNRNFAHFFGLNNFFVDDGDAREIKNAGSAFAMKVEKRLTDNPNLIALGKLSAIPESTDVNAKPKYSYERNIGDNSIIQALAKLGVQSASFEAAGGLGQTKVSFSSYAGQIIGAAATNATAATTTQTNAQTLLDGYGQRSDSISGVNLDEELANTIVYQNSYSASARIITVVSALFETLLQIGG